MINKDTQQDGKKTLNNYSEMYLIEIECKLPGRQKFCICKRHRELPSMHHGRPGKLTQSDHGFGNGHKTQTTVEQHEIFNSHTKST